jgi:putative inorganic carbon (HCO3(-)) transporter
LSAFAALVSGRMRRPVLWADASVWLQAGAVLVAGLVLSFAPLSLAVSIVGGVAIALVALLHPPAALLLLAFSVPFGLVREIALGRARLGLPEAFLALALGAWLTQGAARRQVDVRPGPLAWLFALFAWTTALSLLVATSVLEVVPEVVKWVEVWALYLMARSVVRPRWVPWLIGAILAAGTVQGLLGVYQFVWQAGPEPFRLGRFLRAFGTFAQPNPYAGYLGMVVPLGLSLTLWALGAAWREQHRFWAGTRLLAYGLATIICIAGIVMSWSRGAWLGLAASGLVVMMVHSGRSRLVLISLILILAVTGLLSGFGLLPPAISARLADLGSFMGPLNPNAVEITDANFSVYERVAHWYAGLAMFANHPWFGVGAGNFSVVYATYALARWQQSLGHAHNIYINVAAETGLIGLIAFLVMWGAAFVTTLCSIRNTTGYSRAVAVGVLGVLIHISVHNLFDNLFVQRMYLHWALLLALI